jgi:hypothetical protein
MSTQRAFCVGDRVRCLEPGSWVHERTGTIEQLDVVSSDGIEGHRVRVDGSTGYTVVPPGSIAPYQPTAGKAKS